MPEPTPCPVHDGDVCPSCESWLHQQRLLSTAIVNIAVASGVNPDHLGSLTGPLILDLAMQTEDFLSGLFQSSAEAAAYRSGVAEAYRPADVLDGERLEWRCGRCGVLVPESEACECGQRPVLADPNECGNCGRCGHHCNPPESESDLTCTSSTEQLVCANCEDGEDSEDSDDLRRAVASLADEYEREGRKPVLPSHFTHLTFAKKLRAALGMEFHGFGGATDA